MVMGMWAYCVLKKHFSCSVNGSVLSVRCRFLSNLLVYLAFVFNNFQEDEKFLTELFAQLTDDSTDDDKRQELVSVHIALCVCV